MTKQTFTRTEIIEALSDAYDPHIAEQVLSRLDEKCPRAPWLDGRVVTLPGMPLVEHLRDARGALVPLHLVKPQDQLQDEAVRKIAHFAKDLSAQIARFKIHTFADINAFLALLDQEYGAKPGGKKGNLTLTSYDGCIRVQVQVADRIEFGPELQSAKALVDECLNEWSSDSRAELKLIVNRAFQVDKEGRINRAEIYMLLRAEIDDERWKRAMTAVRDSMRVVGSKEYVRVHVRDNAQAGWTPVPIDLASV
jgi:hypothetical protein